METIINIADYAPQETPKLLDVAEWIIDQNFIPALKERLQKEAQTLGEIYLDFGELENINRSHEVIMDEILKLLLNFNMLQRTTFINLPYAFYDYLRRICNANAVLAMRFESI